MSAPLHGCSAVTPLLSLLQNTVVGIWYVIQVSVSFAVDVIEISAKQLWSQPFGTVGIDPCRSRISCVPFHPLNTNTKCRKDIPLFLRALNDFFTQQLQNINKYISQNIKLLLPSSPPALAVHEGPGGMMARRFPPLTGADTEPSFLLSTTHHNSLGCLSQAQDGICSLTAKSDAFCYYNMVAYFLSLIQI